MSDTIVEQLTSGLNSQQKAAVCADHCGPVLVLAGAGCGKTLVLTRRIAFCSSRFCSQQHVLALTFTRKAAQEMAERLARTWGINTSAPMPVVSTFHGFGLRILMERIDGVQNFERIGFRGKLTLITGEERLRIIAGISDSRQRRALDVDLLKLDDLLAKKAVHPEKLAALSSDRREIIQGIHDRFQETKRVRGFWDFSDIVNCVLKLFDDYPSVAQHYQRYFRIICVDEFQDTNPLQIALLKKLYDGSNRLFAVGDDDQAIYGFRGADVATILNFETFFPGVIIFKLEVNYRSTPVILSAANKIFKDKPEQYRKRLRAPSAFSEKWPAPIKRHFTDQTKMVKWIIAKMDRIERRQNVPVRDMALLFRINQTKEWVKAAFERQCSDNKQTPGFLTVHSAKGLEFPVVFLCDLEDGVFPGYRAGKRRRQGSWSANLRAFLGMELPVPGDCDIEEEKRLFYVGVTRAQKMLFLLSADCKYHYRRLQRFKKSRFLRLI